MHFNSQYKYITPNLEKQFDKKNLSFKITDSELYMIKENNIKRIHDIIKNSYTAKPNEECKVNRNKIKKDHFR